MPDNLENTNGEEMSTVTAEGDWFNQFAGLLILALFSTWGSVPDEHENPDK